MKIFIVCSNLHKGGAERVGATLANGFVERGHKVFMISNLLEEISYPIDKRVVLKDLVERKIPENALDLNMYLVDFFYWIS